MNCRVLTIAMLLAAIAVTYVGPRQAAAQPVPDSGGGAAPQNWTVNIESRLLDTSGFAGPCTGGSGFANRCPTGSCVCFITSKATASGSVGKGQATVYQTIDFGERFNACYAAYLDIEIKGSKDNESIAGLGGDCFDADVTGTEFVGGVCELLTGSTIFSKAEGLCLGTNVALAGNLLPTTFVIRGKALKK